MNKVTIKTREEIKIMEEGGKRLSEIRNRLAERVEAGVNAYEIEEMACDLIGKSGGKASFKMVPGYKWATCVNVNEGVVHGIPKKEVVFSEGDIVSIDVGLYYKGFHTDTSTSVLIGNDREKEKFLEAGREALDKAVGKTQAGVKVGEVSSMIEKYICKYGYKPISSLTGHGIGKELHEDPRVPCVAEFSWDERFLIKEGITLAIEVMYCDGEDDLVVETDGWTINTRDGKIAALFEETVAVTDSGRIVLTK